ncbi:hypothetical protein AURDEDRAFT_175349 [Auricularia subglabra TFB-10046 SS5]|uniref:EthD domain-containing protein n=1 Tax=Auricularia subglabra (strain TFB-10046 / SS5) TaxID=717982 RepID=J0CXM4_AURST|nr:hypothetical protein AURDEDRAFT_175349 [Auricularia subglabra TFB-10046 SS5]
MPQLVKLSLYIKRKEGVSMEFFHKHWSGEHAKIIMGLPIAQKVLVKYCQYHVNSQQLAALSAITKPVHFDGVAEFWGRSYEDLAAFISDPEFIRLVWPDGEKFLDTAASEAFIGYEAVKHEVKVESEM